MKNCNGLSIIIRGYFRNRFFHKPFLFKFEFDSGSKWMLVVDFNTCKSSSEIFFSSIGGARMYRASEFNQQSYCESLINYILYM